MQIDWRRDARREKLQAALAPTPRLCLFVCAEQTWRGSRQPKGWATLVRARGPPSWLAGRKSSSSQRDANQRLASHGHAILRRQVNLSPPSRVMASRPGRPRVQLRPGRPGAPTLAGANGRQARQDTKRAKPPGGGGAARDLFARSRVDARLSIVGPSPQGPGRF